MAFPFTYDPSIPTGTSDPGLGDNEIKAIKVLIQDIFGLPITPTQVTAAPFSIAAGGIVTLSQIDTTFKNLIGAQGTITTDKPLINATSVWNDSGVTFTALKLNVTDTASAAASLLLDLQVGGASKFKISKAGVVTPATAIAIAAGGTGQTTKTAAFDALSPSTTKGDVTVHDGANVLRLGVGSNAQVLTADSTQASGVKWADPTAVSQFASGTRMIFDQDSAPTGWTRDTTLNDRVIRIVNGSRADGGSWTVSGLTTDHTHTLAATGGLVTVSTGNTVHRRFSDNLLRGATGTTGGSADQPVTAVTGGPSSTSISSTGAWRPSHRDSIIASKD